MSIEQYKLGTRFEAINPTIPEAKSYEEFEGILKTKKDGSYDPVTDIKDITILYDGNKFAIEKKQKINTGFQNVQLCSIVGKDNIEQWMAKFIKNDITSLEKEVKFQIGEKEVIVNTKPGSETVRKQPKHFEYTDDGVKSFFAETAKLRKDVIADYENSLGLIKKERSKLSNKRIVEQNMLKLLEFKAKADIDDINDLIKVREKYLKKDRKRETNEDNRKENTESIYNKLNEYREQGAMLNKFLYDTSALNNFENIPPHYMRMPIRKESEATLLRNVYLNMKIETKKIDVMLFDADFQKVQNEHGQKLSDYLQQVESTNKKEQFVPSPETKQIFNNLIKSYPELEKYTNTPTSKPTETTTTPTRQEQEKIAIELANNPEFFKQHPQKAGGLLDKLTPGFATDWIDNTNREPGTKERAKTGIGLALMIGAGILAWKTASTAWKGAFSKDKLTGSDRGILAAGTAVFGGARMMTGDPTNMKEMGKKIAGLWSGDANTEANKPNASAETMTVYGFNDVNILFAGMSYKDINTAVKEENGKMVLDYDAVQAGLDDPENKMTNKAERKKIMEKLKNDPNHIFHLAMTTMGFSKTTLADSKNAENKYDNNALNALTNLSAVAEYMEKNHYARRNDDLLPKIQEYIKSQRTYVIKDNPLDTLARMGAFEKDEKIPEDATLKTNVDGLMGLTEPQKTDLLKYATKVKKELVDTNQYTGDMSFEQDKNGQLYLKTYGEKTVIDLTGRKLDTIPLFTIYQTLKAANLTNRIQEIFAGQAIIDKPFNISFFGKDVEFQKNNPTDIKNRRTTLTTSKFDTTAITGGRGGALGQISPSLEENKGLYVDYLNKLKIRTPNNNGVSDPL